MTTPIISKPNVPTRDELREHWKMYSADGTNWYVGRPLNEDRFQVVTLKPVYVYNILGVPEGNKLNIARKMMPPRMISDDVEVDLYWILRISCAKLDDSELDNMVRLIEDAEETKLHLRASKAGIVTTASAKRPRPGPGRP